MTTNYLDTVRRVLLEEGYDEEFIDSLTSSQVGLVEMVMNSQEVDKYCFYTQAFDKHIIIDMNHGTVYRFPLAKYDMIASFREEAIWVTEKGKNEWRALYKEHNLYPENLVCASGCSYKGNQKYKYKSVKFARKEYGETTWVNIKIHQITLAMAVEYDVLKATGFEKTHAIHHKKEVRLGGGNGLTNLVLLDQESHLKAHGKSMNFA